MAYKLILAFLFLPWFPLHAAEQEPHHLVTLHLMWVNKTKQSHVLPEQIIRNYNKNENKPQTVETADWVKTLIAEKMAKVGDPTQTINPITRIVDWAQYYPVTVWYDSHFVENPKKALSDFKDKIHRNNPRHPVNFVDVRTLKTVQECRDIFEEGISFYFRVDLLRVLASMEYLYGYTPINKALSKPQNKDLKLLTKPQYFVYADWSVKPMDQGILLDETTKSDLDAYGLVMARKADTMYENNFFILASSNPTLYYSMYYGLVQVNIKRVLSDRAQDLEHAIYYSYRGLFSLYHHLKGNGIMTYKKEDVISKSIGPELFKFLNAELLSCFGTTTFMPEKTLCQFTSSESKFRYNAVPITSKPGHFAASQFG